jgi:hypothetical protein
LELELEFEVVMAIVMGAVVKFSRVNEEVSAGKEWRDDRRAGVGVGVSVGERGDLDDNNPFPRSRVVQLAVD